MTVLAPEGIPAACLPALIAPCDPVSAVGGAVSSSVAHVAAGAVISTLAEALATGASSLLVQVSASLGIGPDVDHAAMAPTDPATAMHQPWFAVEWHQMVAVLLLIIAPLLAASTIGAIIRRDPARLARSWLVALPVAFVATAVAVQVTVVALGATDELCDVVLSGSDAARRPALNHWVGVTATNPVLGAVLAGVVILGGLMLWLELALRAAAVEIVVSFLPLVFAALVWPATARMAKRLVEILAALILSKFVVVAVISLGILAAAAPGAQSVTGVAILLLAAFAPFTLLRLIPLVEAAAIGHLEGVSRRPYQAGRRAVGAAVRAPSHPTVAMLRQQRGGGADLDSRPMTTSPVQSEPTPAYRGQYRYQPSDEGPSLAAPASGRAEVEG